MKLHLNAMKNVSRRNINLLRYFGFLAVFLAMSMSGVWGQVNISAGGTVTQDFTIGTSQTATLPTGWKVDKNTSIRTVGTYTAAVAATALVPTVPMATNASNGIYNYFAGTSSSGTDRSIGWLSSGSATTSGNLYVYLSNNGSSAITNFTINYNVEKYRNGSNAAGFSIQMYYSTNGTSWTSAGSDFLTSFVADGDLLGYASPPGTTVAITSKTLPVSVAAGSPIYLAWNYSVTTGSTTSSAQALGIDDVSITANASSSSTPPTLTADATSNNVDNNIDITFPTNGTWEAAITAVKIGGTALTVTTDYVITAGNIQLKPSGLNTLLTISGSKAVTVEATGYSVANVTQQIDAGAATKLGMKTQPAAPASNGAVLGTQPAVYIQDKYGNTTTSTASVTAAVGAGTWTIGGTASANGVSGTATFTDLTATSAAAVTGATISFTSGSLTGVTSGTFNIPAPATTPTITVTETTVPAMSSVVGSTDAETITIGGTNLTGDITLALSGTNAAMFSVATTPSPLTSAGGTATITYTPTASGSHTATLTLSSPGATNVTRTLNGSASTPSSIIINEVDADQAGVDANEFIELYDGGSGNTSLDGLVVVLYNGSTDLSYAAFDLDGYTTDANGYFLLGNSAVTGVDFIFTNDLLQNGADAVVLYSGDESSFPTGTAVNVTNLIDALVYDTSDADDTQLLVLLNSSQPQVDENGASLGASHSLQRLPNGSGGARNTSTYDQTYPTPGAPNSFQTITWTGATDQVWSTATNWTPNIVPDRGVNATITNVTNAAVIGATANVNNLTIIPNAKLTLDATFNLNVAGDFTIQSDASGTGTFLNNGTLTISGATKVQQYFNAYHSWYMSSPFTGTVIPVDNNTLSPALIQNYNETNNTWPTATATGMAPGIGYMVNPGTTGGASTLSFSGSALNNGSVSVQLTRSATNTVKPGFNLVGNPYPSFINIFKVFDTDNNNEINYNSELGDVDADINIMPTYWYRSKSSGSWGWDTYNIPSHISSSAASGLSVTDYIPPMQAFWVRVNTVSANTPFVFTNSLRTHQDVTGNKFRAPAAVNAVNQILRLQVAGDGISDESVIYFNTNAANGFDMYDSPKILNGSTSLSPDIYTLVGSEELVINGMGNIPYNTEIPLFFKANASTAASFTLKASEISNFEESTPVYIKNNLTGEYQLISDGSDYTFNTSDAIADPAFSLIIKAPGAVTDLTNPDDQQVLIYANANRQIIVTCKEAINVISVYNAVGQNVFTGKTNKTTTVIDNSFTPGVYVVNVNNVTKKVVVR